ncbi:MAG: pilin [Candidatus Magasanikbacteria bacterium]
MTRFLKNIIFVFIFSVLFFGIPNLVFSRDYFNTPIPMPSNNISKYNWTAIPGVSSVVAGESLDFSIKVICKKSCTNNIKLTCDNCRTGITDFISSSTDSSLSDITVNYKFNSKKYIEIIKPKLPVEDLYFTFTADNGVSKETQYFKLNITFPGCETFQTPITCNNFLCLWSSSANKCYSNADETACSFFKTDECSKSKVCALDKYGKCAVSQTVRVDTGTDNMILDQYPVPDGYSGPLPDCAFSGSCRDFNKLIELALKAVDYLFSFVGALAFVFFIYGGFTWIFSFGNSEKVKKGQQIFIYAVIGLVIVFSAYILVDFLLDSLNVSESFRAIN